MIYFFIVLFHFFVFLTLDLLRCTLLLQQRFECFLDRFLGDLADTVSLRPLENILLVGPIVENVQRVGRLRVAPGRSDERQLAVVRSYSFWNASSLP